jgi:hypothetical protein
LLLVASLQSICIHYVSVWLSYTANYIVYIWWWHKKSVETCSDTTNNE